MDLVNRSPMPAGYTTTIRVDGRELLIVAIKGTFQFPGSSAERLQLAAEQAQLTHTDEFIGEPGTSAVRYEIDYVPRKPRCDVLLNGSAYAPSGRPAERVTVTLKLAELTKTFDVVGHRTWTKGFFGVSVTTPSPFTILPISYENAFGGVDKSHHDPNHHRWYPTNHVGLGYYSSESKELRGRPLPNTEERGHTITSPQGPYRPMAFGVIGRAWEPRYRLAGTYDDMWLAHRFPFLPADFDDRYYQSAPPDQQIEHPRGGEKVELFNLTPEGYMSFHLPAEKPLPVSFRGRDGSTTVLSATLDTIIIEPDRQRVLLTWRAMLPLNRNIHEIRQVVVGRALHAGESAGLGTKPHFRSLNELAAWRRRARAQRG